MDNSNDDAERRKYRALRRLNSSNPKCFACGMDDWRCLEAHHLAGQVHDGTTVIVCRNHHRMLSDGALDHPNEPSGADPVLTTIAYFLLGLADALLIIFEKLREFAAYLITRAGGDLAATPAGES